MGQEENLLNSAAEGIRWLKRNPGIFHLMLFRADTHIWELERE